MNDELKNYTITLTETKTFSVSLDAESKDEAINRAMQIIARNPQRARTISINIHFCGAVENGLS